jgi:ATP-dependent RNA circularization protein (DNA/RNA ligase family)
MVITRRVKYPRTPHLPWSPGISADDRVMKDTSIFKGRRVIVTEKMDGENTTMYSDYIHARSIDSGGHESRQWVKNYHAQFAYNIPQGWRFCGENLYAKHTLKYWELPSYFMLFGIWNDSNTCLNWDETIEYAGILDIETVPVLYDGIWDEELVLGIAGRLDMKRQEGYVVRLADSFPYGAFRKSVAKYVRAEHVGTGHHWMAQMVIKNEMRTR